jgi:hypothetical protein
MPELARFFGIIVRMYAEPGAPHHVPHFHAYYGEVVAIFSVDPVEVISGSLPRRQQRLVEAWANCIKENCLQIGSVCRAGVCPSPSLR